VRIDRLKIFLDSMGGGAWPFLVGGVICLVNSVFVSGKQSAVYALLVDFFIISTGYGASIILA
jgi:hypothetical protein